MSDAYLCLRDVVKSYDGRVNAVDGISIDVRRGEFLTLLGPSGSGKTTTLLMIAGFEELTAGTLELEGRSLANVRPYRRNIGMVFQNYALFPHMTTETNVAFPLKMRKFPREQIRPRVEKALELVGLAEFAVKYPRELSGGQQQRVALARALVFEPDVLLLDEPLGALDKNLREQMQVEIKRIHGEVGITTIYVTHDQTEAMTMSDRVAVFNDGKIEQVAPPLEMYHRPATYFVGNFIGDSNFFDATVVDANAGTLRVDSLGEVAVACPGRRYRRRSLPRAGTPGRCPACRRERRQTGTQRVRCGRRGVGPLWRQRAGHRPHRGVAPTNPCSRRPGRLRGPSRSTAGGMAAGGCTPDSAGVADRDPLSTDGAMRARAGLKPAPTPDAGADSI